MLWTIVIAILFIIYLLQIRRPGAEHTTDPADPPTHTLWNGTTLMARSDKLQHMADDEHRDVSDPTIDPVIVDHTDPNIVLPLHIDDEFIQSLRTAGATFQRGRRQQLANDDFNTAVTDRMQMLKGECGTRYASLNKSMLATLYTSRGIVAPPAGPMPCAYHNPDGRIYKEPCYGRDMPLAK